MKIVEQAVHSRKNNDVYCEDLIHVAENDILVTDGVTCKWRDVPWNEKQAGKIASELLALAFDSVHDTDEPFELLEKLNETLAVRNRYRDEEHPLKASVLIYQHRQKRIISYGYNPFLIDGVLFQTDCTAIDTLVKERILSPERFDPEDALKRLALLENSPLDGGFPLLNGKKLNPGLLTVTSTAGAQTIVLATGGYPALFPTLEETEAYRARIQSEDPQCLSVWPRLEGLLPDGKQVEDTAYIRFVAG